MYYLPFAILAYFLNSISVLVDKFLLVKSIPNPLIYVFYFSAFSLIILPLAFFVSIPTLNVFLLASFSTILWTLGAFFMFHALKIGVASRVIPIIGTLIPLMLLFVASINGTITYDQVWAVFILIAGIIFLTFSQIFGVKLLLKELVIEILSAFLFASSYLVLREAYLNANFLTVFVYSRFVLIPLGISLLTIPLTRKIILNNNGQKINFLSKTGMIFLFGQICGGSAELLLTFAISLATPALVNSLQGVQFAFLFIFSLLLSKKFPQVFPEKLRTKTISLKTIGLILIIIGIFILSKLPQHTNQEIGFTYSPRYATSFGLNPRTAYTDLLNELKPDTVRLPIYWDEVELVPGEYDFTETDFYIKEAQKRDISVIPVLGYKQPRWPECFEPQWTKELTPDEKTNRIYKLVEKEVTSLKKYSNIIAWQVENEPFLSFGNCEKVTSQTTARLKKEIDKVRNQDSRPILITDSGELSTWRKSIPLSDWFGTTVYRTVWNPYIGFADYPIPPIFYNLKYNLIKSLFPNNTVKPIVSELQAEPWQQANIDLVNIPIEEQAELFTAEDISKNIGFAKEIDFDKVYLWGVEWWYFMKTHGHPEYMETAQKAFRHQIVR